MIYISIPLILSYRVLTKSQADLIKPRRFCLRMHDLSLSRDLEELKYF